MAPNNPIVNQLFGVTTGLGLGIITLDWSQVTYFSNPLIVPWWAIVNIGVCFIFFYWILVPIIYFTNVSLI
jgi:hypothetical protein